MQNLTMTFYDCGEYGRKHNVSLKFFTISANEYIACRCCFFNGILSPAYMLGQQCLEKMAKSFLLLLDPSDHPKKYGHNLEKIIESLEKKSNLLFSSFSPSIEKFSKYYELTRYPLEPGKSPYKSIGMGTPDVHQVDEIYYYLFDKIPLPDEVKFNSHFAHMILNQETLVYQFSKHWANLQNKEFEKRKEFLVSRFDQVQEFNKTQPPPM